MANLMHSARLLVSDLAFFHAQLKKHDSLELIPYPGRTFPSRVFQHATVLLHQLLPAFAEVCAAAPMAKVRFATTTAIAGRRTAHFLVVDI